MQRVINRNTRLLSMLLCIMMVMSMIPSKAFAETSDAAATKDTVTVSVIGYDKVIASAAEVPIKAFDIAKYTGGTTPEKFTALHAVIYALNNGTSLDLNNQSDFKCVGGYISTIDGLSEFDKGKMSGWMYAVNGIKPDKGLSMCDIKAGDNIVLYYSSSMTQPFAYFTEPVKTVNKDTLFTMTLMGNSGDLGDNSKIKPMSGVAVCVNGKPLEYNTDYDGRVIIKLSEPGEYRITTQQAEYSDSSYDATYTEAKVIVRAENVEDEYSEISSMVLNGIFTKEMEPFEKGKDFYQVEIPGSTNSFIIKPVVESGASVSCTVYTQNGIYKNNSFTGGKIMQSPHVLRENSDNTIDVRDCMDRGTVNKLYIVVDPPAGSGKEQKVYELEVKYEPWNYEYVTIQVLNENEAIIDNKVLSRKNFSTVSIESIIKSSVGYSDIDIAEGKIQKIKGIEGDWAVSINGTDYIGSIADKNVFHNGDNILVYIKNDQKINAVFNAPRVNVNINEEVNLCLNGIISTSGSAIEGSATSPSSIGTGDVAQNPVEGAKIYINGEESSFTTDEKGRVSLSFDKKGIFDIQAKKFDGENNNILGYCKTVIAVGDSADILSMDIKVKDGKGNITQQLTPSFDPDITEYTVNIDSDVVGYIPTFKFETSGIAGKQDIITKVFSQSENGYLKSIMTSDSLILGSDTTIPNKAGTYKNVFVVIAPDGIQKTYVINIIREPAHSAVLEKLSITPVTGQFITINGIQHGALYDKDTNAKLPYFIDEYIGRDFISTVSGKHEKVRLYPAVYKNSTFKVNGKNVDGQYIEIDLNVGENFVTVDVTAEDGVTTDQYRIKITREKPVNINSIDVLEKNDLGKIDGLRLSYNVKPDITEFTIKATCDPDSEICINSTDSIRYKSGEEIKVPFEKIITLPSWGNPKKYAYSKNVDVYVIKKDDKGNDIAADKFSLDVHRANPYGPDRIYEAVAGPGQFTSASMEDTLRQYINNDNMGNYTSLGSFGGYCVYQYDKPLKNSSDHKYGIDFIIYGNAFPGNSEPAAVMVAQDKNKDGKPDKWYNIAGSSHYMDGVIWDYDVTYVNPDPMFTGLDTMKLENKTKWYDNYGNRGVVNNDTSHVSLYPNPKDFKQWNDLIVPNDKITLKGVLIDGEVVRKTSTEKPNFDFGYADIHTHTKRTGKWSDLITGLNSSVFDDFSINYDELDFNTPVNPYEGKGIEYNINKGDGIDISWAVDENRIPVKLDEISFIKTYSCVLLGGGFGEVSPEIGGICRTREDKDIGTTPDINGIEILDKDGNLLKNIDLSTGSYSYDVDLIGKTIDSIKIKADTNVENLYIADERVKSESDYTSKIISVKNKKLVRIIAQSGESQPVIYMLKLITEDSKAPKIKDDITSADAKVYVGDEYQLDLSNIFIKNSTVDILSYSVSVDGKDYVKSDSLYKYVPKKPGIITLKFKASCDSLNSDEYTLNLTVSEKNNDTSNLDKTIKDIINYLTTNNCSPKFGDEWVVMGLARSNYKNRDYYTKYYADVLDTLKNSNGALSKSKYTEYSRTIIGLTALGKDVKNIGGYNLLKPLGDFDKVIFQGINGAIFALIALDTKDCDIPSYEGGVQTTRDKLIEHILNNEIPGGGWALSGNVPDPDVTAMAVQSLSSYQSKPEVKSVIDRALNILSKIQQSNGGYISCGLENAESAAQVLTALSSLGIDAEKDSRFIKNGNSTLDNIINNYYLGNGSFKHIKMEQAANGMATEQCFYALVSYARFLENKTSLYDMSDVNTDIADGEIKKEVTLRIEGISKNLLEGEFEVGSDVDSALELLKKVLDNKKIPYSVEPTGYLTSINNESHKTFNEDYDGWQYMVNNKSPYVGMDKYHISNGDSIVVYYGGMSIQHPIVTVKKNVDGSITVTFTANGFDENWNSIIKPIAGASVTWYYGNSNEQSKIYTTDSDGKITVEKTYASAGNHNLQIEKYSAKETCGKHLPMVVRLSKNFTVNIASDSGDIPKNEAYIRVADPNGKTFFPKSAIEVQKGETALSLLKKTGLSISKRDSQYGIYVEGIEGLYEFDKGPQSGWMYRVNGVYPGHSSAYENIKSGDYVEWLYTRDLGKDIGGYIKGVEDGTGSESVNVKDSVANIVIKPNAKADADGKSVADLNIKDLADAIKKVKDEADKKKTKSSITIDLTSKDKLKETVLTIPSDGIKQADKENIDVIKINTGLSNIEIDKKTITELGKSVGSKITLTVSSQISEKIEKDFPGIKRPVVRLNIISDKQEIKEFNGGKLKITIPYKLKESETKDKLIVYAIDDNNNLNLNKYVLYDEKASSVVFETEKLSSFAVGYEVFDDINNHWAYDSIHNAYARGLFSGTGEHIFSPDENTTRAMFVTVLSRYEKAESKNSTINFSDVQDGAWYKEAVAWASSNNIIKGINDREFGCNKEITREQMAVILSRYIKELGINIPSSDENIKYSDSKEISSWAEEAVSYMQKTGLMKGKENNEFDPKAPATRAEISVIINRLSSIK